MPTFWYQITGHSLYFSGKIVPFVELTVAHASALTMLAISFERYYAICEPLKASYVCTKTRALIICLLAWFFAAVFTRFVSVLRKEALQSCPSENVYACAPISLRSQPIFMDTLNLTLETICFCHAMNNIKPKRFYMFRR